MTTSTTSPTSPTSLGHYPAGDKWEFDESVTEVFDDMLARSIPQYDVMRDVTTRVAAEYVQKGTAIVDLGASRGEAVAPLISKFGAWNTYHLIEVSEPMLAAMRARYENLINVGLVTVNDMDLREDYPQALASVTLSVLTLMFIPINYRQRIIQNVYDHTVSGGAFILVEKLLGSTAHIDDLIQRHYHDLKRANGYSEEEVRRKALALEGVQVPVTARWNEDALRAAGFRHIECIWRWMNFAAWLAVK